MGLCHPHAVGSLPAAGSSALCWEGSRGDPVREQRVRWGRHSSQPQSALGPREDRTHPDSLAETRNQGRRHRNGTLEVVLEEWEENTGSRVEWSYWGKAS